MLTSGIAPAVPRPLVVRPLPGAQALQRCPCPKRTHSTTCPWILPLWQPC